jgi:hypothetical protein
VVRGINTGEDIEPLASVPYKKSGPSKSSAKSTKSNPSTGTGKGEASGVSSAQPVGFAVDRQKLSASTEDELAALREAFNIPDSVTMRLPEKGESRSAPAIPGETLVHPFFFGEGLRIPLLAYQQRFLAEVGLAIAQLNPNTLRCLNALYTLYHHCGFGEPDLAGFFNQWHWRSTQRPTRGGTS